MVLSSKPEVGFVTKRKGLKMNNVWHDAGDDGMTGWQPIGEPLIRKSNEGMKANLKEVQEWR